MNPNELTDLDKQLMGVFRKARDTLLIDFLNTIQSGTVTSQSQQALINRVRSLQQELNDRFSQWSNVRIPEQYLKALSQYDESITSSLQSISSLDIGERAGAYLDEIAGIGQVHTEAVKNLLMTSTQYAREATDGITRNMIGKISQYLQTSVYESLAQGTAQGIGLNTQKTNLINIFEKQGITVFRDASGKTRDLSRYSDLLVRTELAKANNVGTINRGLELGITKYKNIERFDCCSICQPYRGRILIVGQHNMPPHHPNCRGYLAPMQGDIDESLVGPLF